MNNEDEFNEFADSASWHRLVGVWPNFGNYGKYNALKSYAVAVNCIVAYLFQNSIFLKMEDPDALPEYLFEGMVLLMVMFKAAPYLMLRDNVLELLNLTKKIRESRTTMSVEEIEILDRWVKYQKFFITSCKWLYVPATSFYMFAPAITEKPLPYQGILPEIAYVKPWYFLVYGIEITISAINCAACVSGDSYLITFICQLCAKLELHITISILLCFAGVTMLTTKSSVMFIKSLLFSSILLTTMLIICYVGELVTNASLDIAKTIEKYSLDNFWDDASSAKILSFALCRAQKPLRIQVGWQISLNLVFFTETMNKILSAFLLLKTALL